MKTETDSGVWRESCVRGLMSFHLFFPLIKPTSSDTFASMNSTRCSTESRIFNLHIFYLNGMRVMLQSTLDASGEVWGKNIPSYQINLKKSVLLISLYGRPQISGTMHRNITVQSDVNHRCSKLGYYCPDPEVSPNLLCLDKTVVPTVKIDTCVYFSIIAGVLHGGMPALLHSQQTLGQMDAFVCTAHRREVRTVGM